MFISQTPVARVFTLLITLLVSPPILAELNSESSQDTARFKMLLDYAMVANAAYLGSDEINKGLVNTGYVLTRHDQLPGYNLSYFLLTNTSIKQQIVAVRGTSNAENAMVDLAIKLLPNEHTGIKLHQGFAQSADFLYDTIKPHLNKNYQLNTTGHSLGGAVALILAMYADTEGYDIGKVITYGQPKVTNIGGSRQYSHLNVTRVVMPKDVVPLVPPLDPMDMMKLDIYWHLGTEIVLQASNTYSELKGIDSMMRATDFLNETISEKNLQHHYMSLYIQSLSQKQQKPERIPYVNDFNLTDFLGIKKTGTSGN